MASRKLDYYEIPCAGGSDFEIRNYGTTVA